MPFVENEYLCRHQSKGVPFVSPARVAELVDALDSKSCAFGRAGSIPAPGTKASTKVGAFFITMEYTVYAISSLKDNYIYVGMTSNLEDRIRRHNAGYERTTKPHRPYELIFT